MAASRTPASIAAGDAASWSSANHVGTSGPSAARSACAGRSPRLHSKEINARGCRALASANCEPSGDFGAELGDDERGARVCTGADGRGDDEGGIDATRSGDVDVEEGDNAALECWAAAVEGDASSDSDAGRGATAGGSKSVIRSAGMIVGSGAAALECEQPIYRQLITV